MGLFLASVLLTHCASDREKNTVKQPKQNDAPQGMVDGPDTHTADGDIKKLTGDGVISCSPYR